ncbi:MAG: hypothetical protein LBE38_05330 [Deltaproteobacteria bacterium]|jgi:dissimilatory sulfite reductase (desulfoviridin) alpha/beta subunit|nr:hypothetical protein [Deltaproteobacteria bacterium]
MSRKLNWENDEANTLFLELSKSAQVDTNPYRRGAKNELISLLGAEFPEVALLKLHALSLGSGGWIQAEELHQIAELSEKKGLGLLELQGRDQIALFATKGLAQEIWENPLLSHPKSEESIYLCPTWGPCLGKKICYRETLSSLACRLETETPGLKLSLSACPRDCRLSLERVDLGLLLADRAIDICLWLGGRHKPFTPLIAPRPFKLIPFKEEKVILRTISSVHNFWLDKRKENESLPELYNRLSQEAPGEIEIKG